MWNHYSVSYIRNNRAASISIMTASFIAALFISMLCSLFYNMWTDDTRRLAEQEGGWQARFTVQMSESQIQSIQNHANVNAVVVTEDGTEVYFEHIQDIYTDMPEIAGLLNLDTHMIEYHNTLLTRQFVLSPEEKKDPPLLWAFYVFIILMASCTLILIIKNAFQFSMNARIHQLGILQSIGATPKQVRLVLLEEAFALSLLPALSGTAAGIGLCICFILYANTLTSSLQLSPAVFEYHYLVFIAAMAGSITTILMSAWLPARRISKLTPLQAIKGGYEPSARKTKHVPMASAFFGAEGELSMKSLAVRRKSYRTSGICLTISFLVLTIFLDFMTLSEISTSHTYFERFKNTWDIMIEIKNPTKKETARFNDLQAIDGIDTITAYKKNMAYTSLAEDHLSDQVKELGSYETLNHSAVYLDSQTFLAETPLVILDDDSYEEYRHSIAPDASAAGANDNTSAILMNTIWDSKNSPNKDARYIPFLAPAENRVLTVYPDSQAEQKEYDIPVAAYTETAPALREEYPDYSLVLVLSQSTYEKRFSDLPVTDQSMYINVCAVSDHMIKDIETQCKEILTGSSYTIENRPEKEKVNAEFFDGYRRITGILCGLLACIGIANVFANTLGFIHQRKREFARYQSVGLTPGGIRRMLFVEALAIGLKPLIISIPFNVMFMWFAIHASGVTIQEYLAQAPILPKVLFALVVLAAVGLSYRMGYQQLKNCNLAAALKDDSLY